ELARAGGAVVVDEPKPGYGSACLAGLEWIARQDPPPDIVAFLDADLADDPAQLPVLCAIVAAADADLVIGSRHRRAEPGSLTSTQRFGNRLSCWLIRHLAGGRFTDLGPMRVIDYATLLRLGMVDRTWGWTVEMQFKAAATGVRAAEVDVPYRRRRAGDSKISGTWIGSARAGFKILLTVARLWWKVRVRS
ncbi:MAG: UDP-glucose--dolichyl-phosphate glucosyltransferase, partial [Phycisphaeraceae bacterium]|nr:UDP-glucose--dolichyl-phosphate glucosyltransferase [Phycisphaeraceae bacterium]